MASIVKKLFIEKSKILTRNYCEIFIKTSGNPLAHKKKKKKNRNPINIQIV